MVASVNNGMRIGAAVFALGLSLAGPQAAGVAVADRGDAGTTSSSVRAERADTRRGSTVPAPPKELQPAATPAGNLGGIDQEMGVGEPAADGPFGLGDQSATPVPEPDLDAAAEVIEPGAPAADANAADATAAVRPAVTTIAVEEGPPVAISGTTRAPRRAVAPAENQPGREAGMAAVSSAERADSVALPSTTHRQRAATPESEQLDAAPNPTTAVQLVGGPAPAATVTPTVLMPRAAIAPAAAAVSNGQPGKLAMPAPGQVIATVTVRIAQAFDRVGDWLSRLPATPFTEFLSGALLLVRRTLLPNVPTIPKITVSTVSVLEGDSGSEDAVFTVTLDRTYTTFITVAYATVEPDFDLKQLLDRDSPSPATAGEDYTPVSGMLTFAPGQTTQQVAVIVLSDTVVEPTETFGLYIYAALPAVNAAATGDGRAAVVEAGITTSVVLAQGFGAIAQAYPAYEPPAGCACQDTWSFNGITYTGGKCGNPDGDVNGPWCRLKETHNGLSWSYCRPKAA